MEVESKLAVDDQIEVLHPGGNPVVALHDMRNLDGDAISVMPSSPLQVSIPREERYQGALLARLLPACVVLMTIGVFAMVFVREW